MCDVSRVVASLREAMRALAKRGHYYALVKCQLLDYRNHMSTTALGTGIIKNPAIHNGEPIIAGTSTPVRAVVELWNQGMTPEQIPLHLPHLPLAHVLEALHYYLGHRDEVDQYIASNQIPETWKGKRFDPATGQVQ